MSIEEKLEKCKVFIDKVEKIKIRHDDDGYGYVPETEFKTLQDAAWHLKIDLTD